MNPQRNQRGLTRAFGQHLRRWLAAPRSCRCPGPAGKRTQILMGVLLVGLNGLAGQLVWSPGGSPGGDGDWAAGALVWDRSGELSAFAEGSDLRFPAPAGTVGLEGSFRAAELSFAEPGYFLLFNNDEGDFLSTSGISGEARLGFQGVVGADADAYPPLEELRPVGLELRPEGTVALGAELRAVLSGSPVLGVVGDAGKVAFAGRWFSDSGSIIPWLRLEEGGHFALTSEAEMFFIKEGFFTLQLWVHGDGTGTLELEEGFVADRTDKGLVQAGIGSIRMGGGTLISHETANLPLGYRPKPGGTVQTNGHLAFENQAGNRWVVRGSDQVYPGAVWIYRDMELVTETDLMHVGITEDSPNYTARNGWSVLGPARVTKTGSGSLVLAGEQSYAPGAYFEVREGELVMRSDPASGHARNGAVTGAQLTLQVASGGRLQWSTDGALQSFFLDGEMRLDGTLAARNGGLVQFGAESRTRILLREGMPQPLLSAEGPVFASGTLVVERVPEYLAEAGDRWVLAEASDFIGTFGLEDRTGMDLELVTEAGRLLLVAGKRTPDLPGAVILEDGFDDQEAAPWQDLSLVPEWGSPGGHHSAFEQVDSVVRLIRSGPHDTSSYTNYALSGGLKTFTALDFAFPEPVLHASSEVTVDFRLRWPHPTEGSGEGGRFMVLLNHEYPEGGLDLTPEGEPGSRVRDFSQEWWARPAYHVRLRNGMTRAGSSFLQYGGGESALGEYERTGGWWLPGFVSGAGQVAPGAGDDFPANSWVTTREGMAAEGFRSFRYRVLPDRQELWRDDNDDGLLEEGELKAVMPLPRESDAPLYTYYEAFEGIRLFWNGRDDGGSDSGQVELDWLRVVHSDNRAPVADAGEDRFARILVDGLAPVRVDGSASSDPEADPLTYLWYSGSELLAASPDPVSHLMLPIGTHALELLVLDRAGNHAVDTLTVTVTAGQARPVADPGPDQWVSAMNDWFGLAELSAGASYSPEGELVRYQWTAGAPSRILYDGPHPEATVALPIGTHALTLTVWDADGLSSNNTLRVVVEGPANGDPSEVIYRENFSRPPASETGEMAPEAVGWDLMRYDGEPVAAVKYDGNAHRSLAWDPNNHAPYLPKVNADPAGTEYGGEGSFGHMWMNQMPSLNASPGEWMLWTEEFAVDPERWEPATVSFHAYDGSPERVKVAPAVRIDGQWYIGWDLRVETRWSTWRPYAITWSRSGWYRFDPSLLFSVRDAEPVENLPDGVITAFGLYMFKDYAWYVNEIDNITLHARPARPINPYGNWVATRFPQSVLTDPMQHLQLLPERDPDGDGWSNAWAYAMGLNPMDRSGAGVRPEVVTGPDGWALRLPWNPEATNARVQVYQSDDLINWVPLDTEPRDVIEEGTGRPCRQWPIPQPDSPAHYYTLGLEMITD